MYSPLPIYSAPKKSRRWNPTKGSASLKPAPETSPPPTASSTTAPPPKLFQSFSDLLDPAVDGPPSPERLRALANQMRQTSVADKHQSQQTTSSGSSSVLSTASDRPSWEHGAESLTLSRKSSQRSTTSSMPSRERPESVQIFGKTIFNRRGKGRRESSDLGSSNSSQHSAEGPGDAATPVSREQHFLNSMLARRKGSRDDESSQRKVQISGPYNFQHLAHTEKDNAPQLDRSSRMDLAHEFAEMRRGRRPTNASLRGVPPTGARYSEFPPETYSAQQDPSAGLHVSPCIRPEQAGARQDLPPPVPKRSIKRTQSQEQIRAPPPRPPRSPTDHSFGPPMPPPPRISSRGSMRPEGMGSLGILNMDRPTTGSGIKMPHPIVFASKWEAPLQSTATLHGAPVEQQHVSPNDQRFSHAITTPDNAAWPLSTELATTPLPDVPEEEESYRFSRSRISVTSNSSSLRGSVSVPLLRQMSQSQAATTARPPSGASETLGRFDLLAAQRALRANCDDESIYDELAQESWEDDIDYCYEHAAEADCDYAWERPSMDLIREEEPVDPLDTTGMRYPSHGSGSSGLLSPPGRDDVPALSPVSQISVGTQNEARTPTVAVAPVTSNFSLPRRDSSALLLRSHNRNVSHADSFKEANGFDLSPSLLIPSDYHQQMLLHERGELREEDEDLFVAPLSPSGTHFAKSSTRMNVRSSASTTDSTFSDRSGFSNRHKSNTSTSTILTRWTSNSTTTATVDAWQPDEKEQHAVSNFEKTIISPLPELDEARFRRDPSTERHARTQSHANVLVKSNSDMTISDHVRSGNENLKTRRRAKTTSRSHNQAPVTLALFPPTTGGRF
ncbi:hypothetical protein AB5N19_04994 [Seiridium cardinale]|uniref:CRIB domain-containing protein n=1 Tax=Seiridium cardinale TaxID=138064 RepID=A0ABR2XFN0_9PEZI